MPELQTKLDSLQDILLNMKSVLLAYSGGLDSTFLLRISRDVLKDKIVAVTARSSIRPAWEIREARKNTRAFGVKHLFTDTLELKDRNFTVNSPQRCYYCKKRLFSKLIELKALFGLEHVVDGTSYSDISDFRPGVKALAEFGVRSPLRESLFIKREIRMLSKGLGLSVWSKPSFSCLATRFPYGVKITKENLLKIERAEKFLRKLGLKQVRARVHGDVVRIEVLKEDVPMLIESSISERITEYFKVLGYTYVTLDLQGYRMGSMDETLGK